MSTCLVVICKDIGEKINCPGDFVIVYMTDFPTIDHAAAADYFHISGIHCNE